jgi:hypothetical protein
MQQVWLQPRTDANDDFLFVELKQPHTVFSFFVVRAYNQHTVDGCEILHQLVDGLSMFIPLCSHIYSVS